MEGERINFGRLKEVLPIPDLISLQTNSYADFLQMDVPPEKRENHGLQEVLSDTFPSAASGNKNAFGVEFVSYEIKEGDNDLSELLKAGGTYQGDLYVTFRMKGASNKDIREERIRMGHLPLMTPSGSFIINGSERVIVSQLHRSPGVCFETNHHPSGKLIYSYKILPDHGSWLEVQFDIKDMMYIYLDRKRRRRKFLISVFLRAFGYDSNREILDAVYGVKELTLAAIQKESEPSHYTTVEDVTDPRDKEVVLANALEPLNPGILENLKAAGIKKLSLGDTDEIGDYFIKCLQSDSTITCEDAQKEIYKRMRPSDPANAQNARALFAKIHARLPPLPTKTLADDSTVFTPAAKWGRYSNVETPELYCVFPFRLCSFEKPTAAIGRRTYETRRQKTYRGWNQDELFAAYLGLAHETRTHLVNRVVNNRDAAFRWPTYWQPNFDWRPDQCAGGNIQNMLQSMLLQWEGKRQPRHQRRTLAELSSPFQIH